MNDDILFSSLHHLGIDSNELVSFLAPTFRNLDWDFYDVRRRILSFLAKRFDKDFAKKHQWILNYYEGKVSAGRCKAQDLINALPEDEKGAILRIKPFRQRSVKTMEVIPAGKNYTISLLPPEPFFQPLKLVNDQSYDVSRVFQETPKNVTSHPLVIKFIKSFADMVKCFGGSFKRLKVNFHQISVVATQNNFGEPVPEGPHQDLPVPVGTTTNWIVSALVIERSKNLTGGESIVLGLDKTTPYLNETLNVGEFLFLNDAIYFHDARPIYVDPKKSRSNTEEVRRSIIGLDGVAEK